MQYLGHPREAFLLYLEFILTEECIFLLVESSNLGTEDFSKKKK